jgi:hypothetical protein
MLPVGEIDFQARRAGQSVKAHIYQVKAADLGMPALPAAAIVAAALLAALPAVLRGE